MCNHCTKEIVDTSGKLETVYVYGCSHQFHAHCLSGLQKANASKKCPICTDLNYMEVRERRMHQERRMK